MTHNGEVEVREAQSAYLELCKAVEEEYKGDVLMVACKRMAQRLRVVLESWVEMALEEERAKAEAKGRAA